VIGSSEQQDADNMTKNPLGFHSKHLIFSDTPPAIYDGFGFFTDAQDGKIKFFFFDEISKALGALPPDPNAPNDREAYHVILSSVRKGDVYLERPFISHFIDALVYARRMAEAGFTGVMMKANARTHEIFAQTAKGIMSLHFVGRGFYMKDDDGREVFYGNGATKEVKE
jgi:hypothetical protein